MSIKNTIKYTPHHLALVMALMFSTFTHSAVIQLTDPSGMILSNNFESTINNADITFDSTVKIVSADSWTGHVTPSGGQGILEFLVNAPLVGSLSSAKDSIGFWFGNDDFGLVFDAVLEVFDGAGLIGSVAVSSNGNDFADQFIGLKSDMAFDSFHFYYERPQANQLAVYIDDVYLGVNNPMTSASVVTLPTPGSLALLSFGLITLGISRRKA